MSDGSQQEGYRRTLESSENSSSFSKQKFKKITKYSQQSFFDTSTFECSFLKQDNFNFFNENDIPDDLINFEGKEDELQTKMKHFFQKFGRKETDYSKIHFNSLSNSFIDWVAKKNFDTILPKCLKSKDLIENPLNIPDFLLRISNEKEKCWILKSPNQEYPPLTDFRPFFYIELKVGSIEKSDKKDAKTKYESSWVRQTSACTFMILLSLFKVYKRSEVEKIMHICGNDYYWTFSYEPGFVGFTGVQFSQNNTFQYSIQTKEINNKKELCKYFNMYFNYMKKFSELLENTNEKVKDDKNLHSIVLGDGYLLGSSFGFVETGKSGEDSKYIFKFFPNIFNDYSMSWLAVRMKMDKYENELKSNCKLLNPIIKQKGIVIMAKCDQTLKGWLENLKAVPQQKQLHQLLDNLIDCILDFFVCGLCHKDIRIPNIAILNDKFILIDWDFSDILEDESQTDLDGEIFGGSEKYRYIDALQLLCTLENVIQILVSHEESKPYFDELKLKKETLLKIKDDKIYFEFLENLRQMW